MRWMFAGAALIYLMCVNFPLAIMLIVIVIAIESVWAWMTKKTR